MERAVGLLGVATLVAVGFYGWKDPRTTLTIRLYLPYLENPHFISCFREPDEVAKSLVAVGGFTLESAKKLTKIYNQRLLKFLTEFTEI